MRLFQRCRACFWSVQRDMIDFCKQGFRLFSGTKMGVFYAAFPLDDNSREWLDDEGVAYPKEDGTAPTPNQLKKILSKLDGHLVEFNIKKGVWQADVSTPESPDQSPWTLLDVMDYCDAKTPCRFGFDKGSPELVIKIAHRIAQLCGPIVVAPDTGCAPVVVEADSDVEQIVQSWEHITG